jgi:hypothetical protein
MAISERSRVFICVITICVVNFGILQFNAFAGPPREMKVDLEFDDFNAQFDKQLERGFRLIDVAIYKVGTRDLYSAIWEKRADPPLAFRHGLTRPNLERKITELANEQYGMVYLEGKGGGGREKYACIWEPCTGEFPQVWVGMDPEQFKAKHTELQGKQYSISNLTAFELNGQVVCGGIWQKENLPTSAVQINLSAGKFKLALKKKPAEGFRLSRLCSYILQGKEFYSCLWTKQEGPKQEVRSGLSTIAAKRVTIQMQKKNMHPKQIAVFLQGSRLRYAVLYEDNK